MIKIMNLRDLKYIVAVAETKHFGKAAERCFISQPTLSGQIKKLEYELGVAIFERTNRSVEITPVGKSILVHARLIIEQTDVITQLSRAQKDPVAGALRIGAIPSLSPYLMPLILMPLKKQYPQMKLIISEEMTYTLLERLRNHEIDAALLATDVDEKYFNALPLFEEPFWLAYPSKHRFCKKEEITRHDLETDDAELLLLSDGHCLAKQAANICRLNDRKEHSEMADLRASSLETLLQLVGAGFGTTIIPALAMRGSWTRGNGIVTQKLKFKNAYRRISLVFRKSYPRKQALKAFTEIIFSNLPNTVKPITGKQNKN